MLLITGTFRLDPAKLDAALGVMRQMITSSRDEDGCIAYSYAQDILEPSLIRVHEVWRDQEALDRHFASTHIREWRSTWPQLQISGRDLTLHALGEGKPT